MTEQNHLGDALDRLAGALESLELGPASADLSSQRDRLVGTLRSYLIPRAIDTTTPLVVVLAGPTGSGKSTIANSLVGLDISRTGALRPTTTAPVVLAASRRAASYESIGGVHCEVATGHSPILETMVLVDTPDIDSTKTRHRVMAETMIDHADLVVFVTSALRYADDIPWQVLRRASSRGTPIIHVLNRVGSATAGAIVDLKTRLGAAGLDDELVTISEHHLADLAQQLPSLAMRSLRKRLFGVAANRERFTADAFADVLRATVGQTADLTLSITRMRDDMAVIEGDLSGRLAERVTGMALSDLAEDLIRELPQATSRVGFHLWRLRVGRRVGGTAETGSMTVDRIVTFVESDIRRWLLEESDDLHRHDIDARPVVPGILRAARSAGEGSVDFATRLIGESDVTELGSGILAERIRRDLMTRLEVVYELAASLVVENIRLRHGTLDVEELRACLGPVAAALAPVHA
jgi:energy-coupling factor transporter ATP-binding protein EcfA2